MTILRLLSVNLKINVLLPLKKIRRTKDQNVAMKNSCLGTMQIVSQKWNRAINPSENICPAGL